METAAQASTKTGIVGFFDGLFQGVSTVLIMIGLVVVTFLLAKIVSMILRRIIKGMPKRHPKFTNLMVNFVNKVISVIIYMVAILISLSIFGIDLTPVIAGLGITGVVLGFALQESISSLFSGFMLVLNRPYRLGDYVDIGGVGGTITDMDMMSVRLRTPDNRLVTMSNKNVWASTITNFSDMEARRVDMSITVAYGSDLDRVKKIIENVLSTYTEILKDRVPTIEVSEVAESGVKFVVRPWTLPGDYWTVFFRFQKDIINTLEKEGIEIPYNKMDISVHNK